MKFLLGSCILLAVVHSWSESESRGGHDGMHQTTRYDHVDEKEQNTPMDRPAIGQMEFKWIKQKGTGVCAGVTNPDKWRNPPNMLMYSFKDCTDLCEHDIPKWGGAPGPYKGAVGCPRSMTYNYYAPERTNMYCFCHREVATGSEHDINLNDWGIENLPYNSYEWGCYAIKITNPKCVMAQGQYDCRGRCASGHSCYSDGTCRRNGDYTAQESCRGTCGPKNCCNSATNRCATCGSFTAETQSLAYQSTAGTATFDDYAVNGLALIGFSLVIYGATKHWCSRKAQVYATTDDV